MFRCCQGKSVTAFEIYDSIHLKKVSTLEPYRPKRNEGVSGDKSLLFGQNDHVIFRLTGW